MSLIDSHEDCSLKVLPPAIRDAERFIRWKPTADIRGNVRKTPVCRLGNPVGYNDRKAQITSEEAAGILGGSTGEYLGITLLSGLPIEVDNEQHWLWCLDFDGFAERDGSNVDDGVINFLDGHNSYTEMSFSGTGFKYFFLSEKEPTTKFKVHFGPSEFIEKYPEVRKYQHREIEILSRSCFLALTGEVFDSSTTELNLFSGEQFDSMIQLLENWAVGTGGLGLEKAQRPFSDAAVSSTETKVTYSKLTKASLKDVLRFIDHENEEPWTDVCNVLTRVYGEEAREYFHAYSKGNLCNDPYAGYTESECDDRYDRAIAELGGRPYGYGIKYLLSLAKRHTDWQESIVEYEPDFDFPSPAGAEDITTSDKQPLTIEQVETIPSNIDRMDIRNGERFAAQFFGQLRFVRDTGDVLKFDLGRGWVRGNSDLPMQAAKAVVAKMTDACADAMRQGKDAKMMLADVKRSSSRRAIEDMIKLARSEPGMSVSLSELDNDPYLLGVQNGVIDLQKGSLLPCDPNTMVTKYCNVRFEAGAKCPRFRAFLEQVIPDKAQRDFLVGMLGYFLTGLSREQLWFFFHGIGSNGKTVIISLLENLLGDYAAKIPTEMLMQQYRSSAGAAPDLLRLQGKRLVFCNETKEGQRLDDARVKDLTGGDTITGRPLYSNNNISFRPTHKLVVVGNYHPTVSDDSHGFWRRVVLYPFSVCIPEEQQDKGLLDKLILEGPGILNYLLEALKIYFANGLEIPKTLSKATQEYRTEQDMVQQFLDDKCVTAPDKTITKQALYSKYTLWCSLNGFHALSSNRFSRKLSAKRFKVSGDKRTWVGVGPTPP